MRRKTTTNCIVVFALLACLYLVAGCQQQSQEDDNFQILVFSDIPEIYLEEMKGTTNNELGTNLQIEIAFFPPVVERLVIEIVRHSGDMLIMDRDLLAAAYDSKELYQLDEFRNSKNTIELTEFELEALRAAEEKVEKGDIYLNALRVNPIENNRSEQLDLVAIIPKYTKNEEVAFFVLEKIIQK